MKSSLTIPPTFTGAAGNAWLADHKIGYRQQGKNPDDFACLGSWVIERPHAHPAWDFYSLDLIHLRPLPSQEQPDKIYLQGATHEIWLAALDPATNPSLMIETGVANRMHPLNFAAQFIASSDEEAVARCKKAVQEICDGTLHPDSDFRAQWVDRFGNNMLKDDYK